MYEQGVGEVTQLQVQCVWISANLSHSQQTLAVFDVCAYEIKVKVGIVLLLL